jgi:hypothetical protein
MQPDETVGRSPEPGDGQIIEPSYFLDKEGVVHVFYGERKVGFGYALDKEEPFFETFYLNTWAYVTSMNGDIKPCFPWNWCYGKLNKWYPCIAPLIFSNEKLEGGDLLQFIADRSVILTGEKI